MNSKNHKTWYVISPEEALAKLDTHHDGLSEEEAESRLEQYGPNRLESGKESNAWKVLFHQITSPLIYILFAATLVTLVIQHWADAIVIGAVILLNTCIGFIQENRAENAIQALISLTEPEAKVRRDRLEREVNSSNLVPGDIVFLEEGNIVPADLRLLESSRLQVDESSRLGSAGAGCRLTYGFWNTGDIHMGTKRWCYVGVCSGGRAYHPSGIPDIPCVQLSLRESIPV